MIGMILKLAVGGAATALGMSVGKDVAHDVRSRYKRAKLRRELTKVRGEDQMGVDELEDLKREVEGRH